MGFEESNGVEACSVAMLADNLDWALRSKLHSVSQGYNPYLDFVVSGGQLLDWIKIDRPHWLKDFKARVNIPCEGKAQVLRWCLRCRRLVYSCRCTAPRLNWTGRMFVEFCRNLDDVPRMELTGIMVSDADLWFEVFYDGVFFLPRTRMVCWVNLPYRHTWLNDVGDGNACGIRAERELFELECEPLFIPFSKTQQATLLKAIQAKECGELQREGRVV